MKVVMPAQAAPIEQTRCLEGFLSDLRSLVEFHLEPSCLSSKHLGHSRRGRNNWSLLRIGLLPLVRVQLHQRLNTKRWSSRSIFEPGMAWYVSVLGNTNAVPKHHWEPLQSYIDVDNALSPMGSTENGHIWCAVFSLEFAVVVLPIFWCFWATGPHLILRRL